MLEIKTVIWLFPVLFMIHDFEEIILINEWKKKEFYNELKFKPFNDFISTASFSVAVAQEFILFALVTFISSLTNHFFLWFGLFSAIEIHFVLHSLITVKIKKIHPGLVSSVFFMPIGIYLLYTSSVSLGYSILTMVLSTITGMILLLGNLKLLHKLMPLFEKRIQSI